MYGDKSNLRNFNRVTKRYFENSVGDMFLNVEDDISNTESVDESSPRTEAALKDFEMMQRNDQYFPVEIQNQLQGIASYLRGEKSEHLIELSRRSNIGKQVVDFAWATVNEFYPICPKLQIAFDSSGMYVQIGNDIRQYTVDDMSNYLNSENGVKLCKKKMKGLIPKAQSEEEKKFKYQLYILYAFANLLLNKDLSKVFMTNGLRMSSRDTVSPQFVKYLRGMYVYANKSYPISNQSIDWNILN